MICRITIKVRSHFITTLCFITLCAGRASYGQVGIGTTDPDPSAILDLFSPDRGLLLPRVQLSNLSKDGLSPALEAREGLLVYQRTDTLFGDRGLYVFDGSAWRGLSFNRPEYQQWQWNGSGLHYSSGDVFIGESASTNNNLWLSRRLVDWDNSNYFLDPAAGSALNEVKLDSGSTADVSLYFDREDTGFFAPAHGALGISVYGHLRLFLNTQGQLGINTSSPEADLDLNGSVKLGANSSILQGVKRFSRECAIPANWAQNTMEVTLDNQELAALNIPISAFIQVQVRNAPNREVWISKQGIDQNSFYLTLEGIGPSSIGQNFTLDFLALF
jgi:hypothetical protein